jgi:hypothetical protein
MDNLEPRGECLIKKPENGAPAYQTFFLEAPDWLD